MTCQELTFICYSPVEFWNDRPLATSDRQSRDVLCVDCIPPLSLGRQLERVEMGLVLLFQEDSRKMT